MFRHCVGNTVCTSNVSHRAGCQKNLLGFEQFGALTAPETASRPIHGPSFLAKMSRSRHRGTPRGICLGRRKLDRPNFPAPLSLCSILKHGVSRVISMKASCSCGCCEVCRTQKHAGAVNIAGLEGRSHTKTTPQTGNSSRQGPGVWVRHPLPGIVAPAS